MTVDSYATLLEQIEPQRICSADEYSRHMKHLEMLMSRTQDQATSRLVEMLSTLLVAYEAENFPTLAPEVPPHEALA